MKINIEKTAVNELLPQFIRQESQTFIEFLEHYYEFVNSEGNPSYVIDRIVTEHDLDKVFDPKYLARIRYELANSIPLSPVVQKAFLLKRIVDYYGTKGNTESVKFFFRVFFGDDITVYNPWDTVFKTSSGKWVKDTILNVVLYQGTADQLVNAEITQLNAAGRFLGKATVQHVNPKRYNGKTYFELVLRNDTIVGAFTDRTEFITADGTCKGNIVRSFAEVEIANKGQGYSVNDLIYLKNKENISFVALVERIGLKGEIEKLHTLDYGVSSEINYRTNITTADLDSLSQVYLSGTLLLDGAQYKLNDIVVYSTSVDLAEFENMDVDIIGNYTNGILEIVDITPSISSDLILHDFNYYNINDPLDMSTRFKSGYTFQVTSTLGSGADFRLRFDPKLVTAGRYEDNKGRPSNFAIIQDSFYYQTYSYEITSKRQISDWFKPYLNLVHPVGSKVFNRIVKLNSSNLNIEYNVDSNIEQGAYIPEITLDEKLSVRSTVGAVIDNYFDEDYTISGYVGQHILYSQNNPQSITNTTITV